jgi:hypothetical protein
VVGEVLQPEPSKVRHFRNQRIQSAVHAADYRR